MKKLEFFQRQLDARDPQVFRAASDRCPELWAPGRTAGRVADRPDPRLLADGRLLCIFAGASDRFVGRQYRRRFSVGDKLRVFVARVDVFKRQVDFAIADLRPTQDRSLRKRRR